MIPHVSCLRPPGHCDRRTVFRVVSSQAVWRRRKADGLMINWKGFRRKRLWLNRGTDYAFLWRDIPAEIRTQDVPNTY